LRKTMVVLAIAFALGGSALSTSAFARSSFGNGHPAGNYAYDSDRVGNSHRGLLQRNGRGYERTRGVNAATLRGTRGVTGAPTTAPCFELATILVAALLAIFCC
jgi:hypothetical protein